MKVTMTQTKMPVMDMNEITTEFTLSQDGRPVGYFTIKGIRILCSEISSTNPVELWRIVG